MFVLAAQINAISKMRLSYLIEFLFGLVWFQVSRLFGFEEVDFPVLESEALFVRKAGEEIRDQVSIFFFFHKSIFFFTLNF